MDFPEDLRFTNNDEWLRIEGDNGVVGVSDYAQDQLSDIVFIDITVSEGDTISVGDEIGTVESVKAASDIYTPVSGTVVAINEGLLDTPELVNSDPYGEAWVIKITMSDVSEAEKLMDSSSYKSNTEDRDA